MKFDCHFEPESFTDFHFEYDVPGPQGFREVTLYIRVTGPGCPGTPHTYEEPGDPGHPPEWEVVGALSWRGPEPEVLTPESDVVWGITCDYSHSTEIERKAERWISAEEKAAWEDYPGPPEEEEEAHRLRRGSCTKATTPTKAATFKWSASYHDDIPF